MVAVRRTDRPFVVQALALSRSLGLHPCTKSINFSREGKGLMEASGTGPRGAGTGGREADIAPADPTAGRSAGWTPADPGPLGLAGFAGTTFVLSLMNANLVSARGIGSVLALAIAYGGLAQLLAGLWEFRTGNTFGAVAFCSFGAFWISFFFLIRLTPAAGITANGIAVYLYMWAIFTTYMFVASL